MVRISVRLTAEESAASREEARRLGITVQQVLVRSLRACLPLNRSAPWMRYAGLVQASSPSARAGFGELPERESP